MATKKLTTEEFRKVLTKIINEELSAREERDKSEITREKALEFMADPRFQKASQRCGWVYDKLHLIYSAGDEGNWTEIYTQPNPDALRIADLKTYIGALGYEFGGDYKFKKGRFGKLDSKSGTCSFAFLKNTSGI